MRINSIVNSRIVQNQQKFKGNSAESSDANTSKNQRPDFLKKLISHPSLIAIPLLPVFCYDIYSITKEKSLKKASMPLDEIKKFKKNSFKMKLALSTIAIPLYFATDYLNKKYKERNLNKAKKQVNDFNERYNVDVKLIISPIDKKNNLTLGGFDALSAQIMLPEKSFEDIIYANFRQKAIIRHELIHAKQHILMACSENGINKMNYIFAKQSSKGLSDKVKSNIILSYNEIKGNDKFNNETTKLNGYDINAVDYITAMYKVLYDKNSNPDNIPIIINKEFYEKAKASKGALTEKEEIKAQKYLEAYEKYPTKNSFIDDINPFSDYRQNLLEKEAYGNQHIF